MMRTLQRRRHARDERGSMAVELVLLAPVLMMVILLIVAGGRYVSVQGDIDAAARDASRAASQERSYVAARTAANRIIDNSLDDAIDCRAPQLSTGDWRGRPGAATVRLDCAVSWHGLGLIGLRGSKRMSSESSAPLDPYVRRSGD